MDNLAALADRIEAAEGPSLALFMEAFEAIHGGRSSLGLTWSTFIAFCEAEAWLDAAMTLVPEGAPVDDVINRAMLSCIRAGCDLRTDLPRFLCAAALRAILQEMNNEG